MKNIINRVFLALSICALGLSYAIAQVTTNAQLTGETPISSSGGTFGTSAALAWPDGSNITDTNASSLLVDGHPVVVIASNGSSYMNIGSNYVRVVPVLAPNGDGSSSLGDSTYHWKFLSIQYTNTAVVGAATINNAAGRVNIAAAGTSVVISDNLVSSASHIFCNVSNVDATAKTCQVTPGANTFTITLNAAATAQVAIDFFVVSS